MEALLAHCHCQELWQRLPELGPKLSCLLLLLSLQDAELKIWRYIRCVVLNVSKWLDCAEEWSSW